MKRFFIKTLLLTILIHVLSAYNTSADEYKAVKTLNKKFQSNTQTLLEINNKFGDIKIIDRDITEIEIKVVISVKANSESFAKSKLKYIDILFSEKENKIKATTVIDKNINNSTGIFANRKVDVKINYYVSIPRNLKINLNNKYGNIYINEIHGKTNIKLKYGNLKAGRLLFDDSKPLSKLTLSYGKAEISECNWLSFNLNYHKIKINKGVALVFVSAFSTIEVNSCRTMVTDSKYDIYKIADISNFTTEGKYSSYKIESIDNKLFAETKYGNISANDISQSFDKIDIKASFTNIKLNFSDKASYYLDANINYGNIETPKKSNINKHITFSDKTVQGIIGTNKNTTSSVILQCKYGNIDLK